MNESVNDLLLSLRRDYIFCGNHGSNKCDGKVEELHDQCVDDVRFCCVGVCWANFPSIASYILVIFVDVWQSLLSKKEIHKLVFFPKRVFYLENNPVAYCPLKGVIYLLNQFCG